MKKRYISDRILVSIISITVSLALASCGATQSGSSRVVHSASTKASQVVTRTMNIESKSVAVSQVGIPRALQFESQTSGWEISLGTPSSYGLIASTVNGGSSGRSYSFSGVTFDFLDVLRSGEVGALGNKGQTMVIATTANDGSSWKVTEDHNPPFSAAYVRGLYRFQGKWLVLDGNGDIWAINPNGMTKMSLPQNSNMSLLKVNGSEIYAVLGNHKLVATANEKSWTNLYISPPAETIVSMALIGHKAWLIERQKSGNKITNTVLASADGGRRFTPIDSVSTPTASNWTAIDMTTMTDGWVLGGTCNDVPGRCATTLLHTSNGGHSWNRVALPSFVYNYQNSTAPPVKMGGFRPAGFFGSNQAVIAFGYVSPNVAMPRLYVTTNTGQEWKVES